MIAMPVQHPTSSGGRKGKSERKVGLYSPPPSGWDHCVYAFSLGAGIGVGMTLFLFLRDNMHAEAGPDSSSFLSSFSSSSRAPDPSKDKSPKFSLGQVTLVCLVGVAKSDKTTQARKIPDRFGGFQVIDVLAAGFGLDRLTEEIWSDRRGKNLATSQKDETLFILDGYSRSLKQVCAIESKLCPIFVVLYFDLPREKFESRFATAAATASASKE